MPIFGAISPSNQLSFRNVVINGDMSVWQRGTTFNSGEGFYTADRWYCYRPGVTRQSNSDNGGFSLRWTAPSTASNYISQGIEGINCVHLRGKQVTLSFEIKTSSAFSAGRIGYNVVENTGTADQNPNAITQNVDQTVATTTSFVRVSRTYTLSSSFNNLYVTFALNNPTNGEWYEIRNVQLEEGSVATPFEKRPYPLELTLCQRYYELGYTYHYASVSSAGSFNPDIVWFTQFNVEKRTTPTITRTSGISDIRGNWAAGGVINQYGWENYFDITNSGTPIGGSSFFWAASAEM